MHAHALMLAALAAMLATPAFAQGAAGAPAPATPGDRPAGPGLLASYGPSAPLPAEPHPEALTSFGSLRMMPAYHVTEYRTPVFRELDLYTKVGMAYASFQRHPGLLVGNLYRLNEPLAYQMFMRDDWNRTKGDYFEMAHAMALGGDAAEGRAIVKAIDDIDVRMRGEAEDVAGAPALGRFQIASAETGTKLLELPAVTIDVPFIKKSW